MKETRQKGKCFLVDAENNLFVIEVEVRVDNELSICGEYSCGGGQCYERIKPANKLQEELLSFWREHHLHKINEETEKRIWKLLEDLEADGWAGETAQLDNSVADVISQYIYEAHGVDVPDSLIQRHYQKDGLNVSCLGWDFLVGSYSELEEEARKYLTEDTELWQEAVQAGNTTLGLKDWADEVIRWDGFATVLNHWNGGYAEAGELCCVEN